MSEQISYNRSGGYGIGFWYWDFDVDLEDLSEGKGRKAITITEVHDTYGTSFKQYYGIERSYRLPDGAKVSALEEIIEDIVNRAEELTAGFSTEWINGNWKAAWNTEVEGCENALAFWERLGEDLSEIDCVQIWNLSDMDWWNYEDIIQAGFDYKNPDSSILEQFYVGDEDTQYINYKSGAEILANKIRDKIVDAAYDAGGNESEEKVESCIKRIMDLGYTRDQAISEMTLNQDEAYPIEFKSVLV
jgi:hypothetical protein